METEDVFLNNNNCLFIKKVSSESSSHTMHQGPAHSYENGSEKENHTLALQGESWGFFN